MYWLTLLIIPALVAALRPGVTSSRRLLAGAVVILVPFVGPVLAALVRRTRGGGAALEPEDEAGSPDWARDEANRLGEHAHLLERLMSTDSSERLGALVTVSASDDAGAVALLRWTVEHGPPEAVLDAALTLEEIDLRGEARVASSRDALAASPCASHALAAAEAAAKPVLDRTADPSLLSPLAEQARNGYRLARELAPARAAAIDERLINLELAAGQPRIALALCDELLASNLDVDAGFRIAELRDSAAFAAREFARMSFQPRALEVPLSRAAVIALASRWRDAVAGTGRHSERQGTQALHAGDELAAISVG